MQIATVIGNAVSTVKHASMDGTKLLIVQPTMADGTSADGFPLVAIDALGAGIGDRVMITSDGASTREMLKTDATPVRWSVVGIQDDDAQTRPTRRRSADSRNA